MHPASFLRLFSSPSSSLSSISQTDRPTLRSTDHYTKNTRWKTSPLILTTPKHSPNLDEIKTHLILLSSDHLFFTRRSCNPSRSTVCTTRRVFLAPFIGRPFFNGPFHHHLAQGKEVEAGTRTNFSGFFSSLPFPPCLIPSSLPASLVPPVILPCATEGGGGGQEVFRTPAPFRCSTFQSTRFPASERRMHRYWIAADPPSRARASDRVN